MQWMRVIGSRPTIPTALSYIELRKADSFKTICQLASAVPNFFAAEVPVQRFNEKENDEATTDVSGSRIPLSLLLLL
jgi:hypothetical protein